MEFDQWRKLYPAPFPEEIVSGPFSEGARKAADQALQACKLALENLPDDQFDRNYHRQDIAGGLAMAGLNGEALDLIESVLSDRGKKRKKGSDPFFPFSAFPPGCNRVDKLPRLTHPSIESAGVPKTAQSRD